MLGRDAQGQRNRRHGGAGRRHCHRAERQAALAAAHRRRRQADPSRSAREDTGGPATGADRGSAGRNRSGQTDRAHGRTDVPASALNAYYFAHDLFRKLVPTLGSSPRTGFFWIMRYKSKASVLAGMPVSRKRLVIG